MRAEKAVSPIRVLLVYSGMIPSVEVCQLRSLRFLAAQNRIDLRHGTLWALRTNEALAWCDIVIVCRCCLRTELPFLLKMQALRIPYIYDLDDNFFRHADTNLPGTEDLRRPGTMEALRAFVSGAALVKVCSRQLQEDVSVYNPRCLVQPIAFDFSILSGVERRPRKDHPVKITYAGSIAHQKDLRLVAGALRRILTEYAGRVQFAFYGVSIEEFETLPNVRFVPYANGYEAFLRGFYAEGWDIAIAPLYDSVWNRSKTNIKYIEYTACQAAGIYSDMPLYNTCVQHGVNGMLCADTEEAWYNALTALIEDPALVHRIQENAMRDVAARYSVDVVAERLWEELILPVYAGSQPLDREKRVHRIRISAWERNRLLARILCPDMGTLGGLFCGVKIHARLCGGRVKRAAKRWRRRTCGAQANGI